MGDVLRAFALLVTAISLAMGAQAALPLPCVTGAAFRCPEWTTLHDAGTDALPWAQVVIRDLLIVAGQGSTSSSFIDYEVAAFDTATGVLRWSARHGGSDYDYVWTIVGAPGGRHVAVTGTHGDTIVYDVETGAEVWRRRLAPGGFLAELSFTGDGTRMVLTGAVVGADGSDDFGVIAVDAATGDVLWVRSDAKADWYPEYGLGVDIVGHVAIAAGTSRLPNGSAAGIVVAYDVASGAELWRSYMPGGVGRSVSVSADRARAYVGGYASHISQPGSWSTLDWMTWAYDVGSGEELWRREHSGPRSAVEPLDLLVGGTDNFPAARMALAERQDLVLVGGWIESQLTVNRHGVHDREIALVAYDGATGETAWSVTHGIPLKDWEEAWGLAVSEDGERTYLVGLQSDAQCTSLFHECFGTHMHAVTLAYDTADGALSWSWRDAAQAGPTDRSAGLAVAESADGARVFTSAWLGRTEGSSWMVVAHDA